ncbi:MAG: polyprenyl diphosphate synthase [bacterium]
MKDDKKKELMPRHIGVIMDGNRRWAAERNLPSLEGHRRGLEKLKEMPGWFFERGVEIVSAFVFSSENWTRSQNEVNYLMKLAKKTFTENLEEINKKGYKLLLSGRIDELPADLPEVCRTAVENTKNNNKGILNLCFNYGGRIEIVDAIKKMIKNNIEVDQVHEGMIKKYLYSGELPDPDVIVRTSGEERLSGFLLWESAYSELMFMKKYWPDFEKSDVVNIIEEYGTRKRRFGGN